MEAAASRIQALNPRVNLKTSTDISLLENEEFLGAFDLIVVTEVDAPTLVSLSTLGKLIRFRTLAANFISIRTAEIKCFDAKTGKEVVCCFVGWN